VERERADPRRAGRKSSGARGGFEFVVYPGVTHAFTLNWGKPVDYLGHHLVYDEKGDAGRPTARRRFHGRANEIGRDDGDC
jgi:hypothetical protein